MKRILLAFVMILCFGTTSFATDVNSDDSTDSNYCTSGYFHDSYYLHSYRSGNYTDQLVKEFHNFTVEDGYIYIIFEKLPGSHPQQSVYRYYLCGNGVVTYDYEKEMQNLDGEWVTTSRTFTYNLDSYDSPSNAIGFVYVTAFDVFFEEYNALHYSSFLYDSDIPIFDAVDVDSWRAYEESGDTSGSLNGGYDDEYDESIPIPHGLKVLQGTDQSLSGNKHELITVFHHDIVLSWNQSDVIDNLQFEIEGQFFYERLGDNDMTQIQEMNTPYHTLVAKTDYGTSDSMSVVINKGTLNGYAERGYQTKLVLRVRNVVGDRTSNWVSVTINLKDRTATATEEDYDDNSTTGGDEYNDTNVDNTTPTVNDLSLDGIQKYISGGFGLLGSGGIISLMSQTFLYLPGSFWDIMKFYVSMIVAVALFALFLKVVF